MKRYRSTPAMPRACPRQGELGPTSFVAPKRCLCRSAGVIKPLPWPLNDAAQIPLQRVNR